MMYRRMNPKELEKVIKINKGEYVYTEEEKAEEKRKYDKSMKEYRDIVNTPPPPMLDRP